jgi:hypothetical protein
MNGIGKMTSLVFLPGFQKSRAQFRPKKAICVVARKNIKKLEKLFTPFRVNKMFSHKFYTFETI